ncbi:MAG: D-alanine--D-alanine ligase [Candidatus Omnitrophica bacterium]|nr:D-alanine--D-alanine ligase [Candidatus Omnitrophota bacterium]
MSQVNGFAGKIGVLMGGNSSERSISLKSGEAVLTALRQKEFNVLPLDIQGARREIANKIKSSEIALAFITLHGRGGEDGFIQTLLEELDIPYIGSSPEGSLKAFNKLESKKIFVEKGIPTPRYAMITAMNWKDQIAALRFPVFIKPVDEGSSIGVKKIKSFEEMSAVAPQEFEEYDSLLAEEAVLGRELTVGILGNKALPVIELRPKREFYDYTAKYTKGMTEYLVPAPIKQETTGELQKIALQAFRALDLRDFSRVDFMLDQNDNPFVLEVNTIPGFTETSLLPKAAKVIGIDFGDLCSTLIQFAKERCLAHGKKK